jgi:hypothetical protein
METVKVLAEMANLLNLYIKSPLFGTNPLCCSANEEIAIFVACPML